MNILRDLFGILVFQSGSLRAQSERRALAWGIVGFSAGFLLFSLVRNAVYASLPDSDGSVHLVDSIVRLAAALFFFLLIYIPANIILARAIQRSDWSLAISSEDFRSYASAMLPLWGLLFLIDAPLQYFAPQFLVVGVVGISVGMLVLLPLFSIYTVWGIKQLNSLNLVQAVAVFAISCLTFPVYYLLTSLESRI